MSKLKNILSSFSVQETLNPKIWENFETAKGAKLKPKVRIALEKIAEKFIENLGDDVFVEDIYLMGSLANYNWSEYSDFDLHVLIDFERYGKQEELYSELFDLKQKSFNDKYDIKIFGYDVEVYAQKSTESPHSDGVYSIMNDEWVSIPERTHKNIDYDVLKTKIKSWVNKIDDVVDSADQLEDVERIKQLREKIKQYRQSGLDKEGEFSYENLVFKFLRRSGHIGKLFDTAKKIVNKELSIEGLVKEDFRAMTPSDIVYGSKFLKSLMDLVGDGLVFEYTPGIKIPYERAVELIQTGLQYLGHSLPKYGVDGKFGPETASATMSFQESAGIPKTGRFTDEDFKYLIAYLVDKDFKDSDLQSIQFERTFDLQGSTDQEFYEKLLNTLNAPVTNENLKFLLAWRQAEGKAGKFNPFNTTHKLEDSSDFNKVGVQNYNSLDDGMYATLKTLTNGRYNCIVNGLKNDIGALEISKCPSLEVWGTGDLVRQVVDSYEKGAPVKSPPLT